MERPLVVGYKGEIGSFILNGLLRVMPKALDILCVDINETKLETMDRIQQSDVIFLCVPMLKTTEWLFKWKLGLLEKIIIEQTSLKGWMYNASFNVLDIRPMHILFKPSKTPDANDRRTALFDGFFKKEMANKISNITNSKIIWFSDTIIHDKEMAIQQALVHRTLLLLGEALEKCHSATYISRKVLELSERIKQSDLDLYKAIQDNRYLIEPLKVLVNGLQNFKIEKFINRNDK